MECVIFHSKYSPFAGLFFEVFTIQFAGIAFFCAVRLFQVQRNKTPCARVWRQKMWAREGEGAEKKKITNTFFQHFSNKKNGN